MRANRAGTKTTSRETSHKFPPLLGGGLEPRFRVLFSAIFHGVSLGNFHQGRNQWKWAEAKV
jgi:hypothetical protein